MAQTRLTNSIRNDIRNHLIDAKFKPIQDQLKQDKIELAQKMYNQLVPDDLQKMIGKFPFGWFKQASHFKVAIDGRTFDLRMDAQQPVPSSHTTYSVDDKLSFNSRNDRGERKQLGKQLAAIMDRSEQHKKDHAKAMIDIDAVLNSVNTRKRLLEVWPELEPTLDRVWPEDQPMKVAPVLAVKMDELNKSLELPEHKRCRKGAKK